MKNTILIVDDEPEVLDLTEKFLKLGDFNTITCKNAKKVLEVIEEGYNDITMILLNPMMPGINKYELLQFIKSDDRYKHILVVLFSGKELPGSTPFPYIPPGPPGAGGVAVRKEKSTNLEKDAKFEPYCKHCGAVLPKGQTICHVCGNIVI